MARINLTQRQYMYIAGGAIVLVLLGVLAWLYFRSGDNSANPSNTTNQVTNTTVVDVTVNANAAPSAPIDDVTVDATRLAQFFSERYGSYTSESNFINMTNLKSYMTVRMQQSTDDFIRRNSGQTNAGAYTDIVTKVLSTTVESQDVSNATIRLSTQRVESGETAENNDVYYQDIILELVHEEGGWLVQSAAWQERGIAAPSEPTTNTNTSLNDLINQL